MSQLSGRHRIMVAARGTLVMTVLKRVERILDEHDIVHHQLSRSRRSDWRLLVVVLVVETISLSRTIESFQNAKPCTCIDESRIRPSTENFSSSIPIPKFNFLSAFHSSHSYGFFRSRHVLRNHQFSKRIVALPLDSLIPAALPFRPVHLPFVGSKLLKVHR